MAYSDTYNVGVKGIPVPPSTAVVHGHDGKWTFKVSYDPTTGKVSVTTLTAPNKGNASYNNWTWTIPGTASGDTVTFSGDSGLPTVPPKQPQPGHSNIITFAGATLNTVTGALDITSIKSLNDTFETTGIKKAPAPTGAAKDGEKAGTSVPPGKSLRFDSLTQTLSITDSTVVALPGSGDPLLGAKATYPQFVLTGFNAKSNSYIFVNQNPSDEFTFDNGTTEFQASNMSYLDYNVAQNLFYGVLTDSTFDSSGSSFIDYVAGALDFNGPSYDPFALYYTEIMPDVNFYNLTQAFHLTGDTGATDIHFLANSVPEPSGLFVIAVGMIGLAALYRNKRVA